MSSDYAIEIEDIAKCFRVYKRPIDRVRQCILGDRGKLYKEIWALKGVTFKVSQGEAVGIIGRNGSGKSTLLEIITDTMKETAGTVMVNGKVAALLELGAGFNPEFTGRENVFTNAAIMGIPDEVVQHRLDAIIEYSELRDYFDQQVKTYSSGMYIRLAFAVAINMDPDILIVDEALSVGDIRFQRKCFRTFEEFKKAGKTILFVTHATDLIINHCDRAVFLDKGELKQIGEPREVVNAYLDFLFGSDHAEPLENIIEHVNRPPHAPKLAGILSALNVDPNIDGCARRRSYNPTEYRWGNQKAKILDYLLTVGDILDPSICQNDSLIDIYAVIYFIEDVEKPIYGVTVKTVHGVDVYGANTRKMNQEMHPKQAGEYSVVKFTMHNRLVAGDYFISIGVARDDAVHDHVPMDRRYDMIHVRIEDDGTSFGIADLGMRVAEIAIG